ncbi:MAG: EAL domain-containing protein [Clostridia bacterium]
MERTDKRTLFYIAVVIMLVITLVISSLLSMAVLNNYGIAHSRDQLRSDNRAVNRALIEKIEQEKFILQSLTQPIFEIKQENIPSDEKKIKYLNVIDNMEKYSDFEEIAISHEESGAMYTLGNSILEEDISNSDYYAEAMENSGSTVLRVIKSQLDSNKSYMVLTVPFFSEINSNQLSKIGEKPVGVIRGAYSYEKWESNLAELASNVGFFRVVDKSGNIIVSTAKNDSTYFPSIGQGDKKVENMFLDIFDFGKDNVKEQMQNGKVGFATMKTPISQYAICYEKFDCYGTWLNEWYIISAIDSKYIDNMLKTPQKQSLAIVSVMLLAVVALGIIVIIYIDKNKKQVVASNIRLNNVIKDISGGIFIYSLDDNYKVLFANESACAMYGYPMEVVKKFGIVQALVDEDKAKYMNELARVQNGEINSFEIEYRIARADGTIMWVLENANVVLLENKERALQTIFVDFNSQKKLEQEMIVKEQTYTLAVNKMGVKIFEYNLQRRTILVFEHRSAQNLNVSQRELTIDEVILSENPNPDDIIIFKQAFEKIDKGELSAEVIIRTYDKDNNEVLNKMTMTAIVVDGKTIRAVGSVDDITSEYRLKKENEISVVRDANKLLIYTANITRDFVLEDNANRQTNVGAVAKEKYSDIISLNKGNNIFVDDRREVYRKLNRSRLLELYNSGVFSGDLEYRRLVGDGIYHYVLTEFWLYKDDFNGDIMALFNIADINEKYLRKIELMHNAEFDGLTGVYNRMSGEQKIKQFLDDKANSNAEIAFMIFDLDFFKTINDEFGHLVGDKALCDVATVANKIFTTNSLVARVGGDEFAVFVWNVKNHCDVINNVENFVKEVGQINIEKNTANYVSISLGLCFSEVKNCAYNILYERADDALLVAKRTGKNRYYEFGSTINEDGIDKITGKMDYNSFKIKAERFIKENKNENIVILYSDIENFKMINHIYGFSKGDELLRKYSDHLQYRRDIMFARTNVDKFVGICLESTAESENVFNNMLYDESVSNLLNLDYPVKRFLGAYKTHGDNFKKSLDEMVEIAALSSKEIESVSKRRWVIYDEEYLLSKTESVKFEKNMKSALENGEFELYLQPQFNLKSNKVLACEGLVRWNMPNEGIIQPLKFIPLFERNGFISQLDKQMFSLACKKIREWIDNGKTPVCIAVNISQVDILSSNFISDYVLIKNIFNVPDKMIAVEFSEGMIVENESIMTNVLAEFKKNGILTAIDDFGAGCTSLNILKCTSMDILKIDKAFFVGSHSERRQMIVESIINMAKSLNMTVVAEGIEQAEQLEVLRKINCDDAQGYIIDKPMTIKDFEKKYIL